MLTPLLEKLNPMFVEVLLFLALAAVLILLVVIVLGAIKYGRPLTFLHIFTLGAQTAKDAPANPATATAPAEPRAPSATSADASRSHRKLKYVKVTYLSDRAPKDARPRYERSVDRLDERERQVPVHDEAVHYTLELYPRKHAIDPVKISSSGVVDANVVIPWMERLVFGDRSQRTAKGILDLVVPEESDTVLTVAHFVNGLQGKEHHDLATHIPEHAEYTRLVVDFSSVPGASRFIAPRFACVNADDVDGLRVPVVMAGDAIYAALATASGPRQRLKMYFDIDWAKAPPVA
jgi:hypothetical protein